MDERVCIERSLRGLMVSKSGETGGNCLPRGRFQQGPGLIHSARHMVAMRRRPEGSPESARKMIDTQIDKLRESRQRNLLREMGFDELRHALLLPCRQATAKRLRRGGCR